MAAPIEITDDIRNLNREIANVETMLLNLRAEREKMIDQVAPVRPTEPKRQDGGPIVITFEIGGVLYAATGSNYGEPGEPQVWCTTSVGDQASAVYWDTLLDWMGAKAWPTIRRAVTFVRAQARALDVIV